MKQEIKDDWVSALTSNEYEQGAGELRTREDQYCCLGVLCDRAVKAGIAQWELTECSGWVIVPINQTSESASACDVGGATLPRFIQDWAGLTSPNPYVGPSGSGMSLAMMNDGEARSFHEIAAAVKEHL